jgi:hypothetical protein
MKAMMMRRLACSCKTRNPRKKIEQQCGGSCFPGECVLKNQTVEEREKEEQWLDEWYNADDDDDDSIEMVEKKKKTRLVHEFGEVFVEVLDEDEPPCRYHGSLEGFKRFQAREAKRQYDNIVRDKK